jgi:hypothetical protein
MIVANSFAVTKELESLCQNLSGPDLIKDRGVPNAPIEGTCEWIIKNEICQNWLNEHMGMLWVSRDRRTASHRL